MKKRIFFVPLIMIALAGCYNDSLEAIHPELAIVNTCDTTYVAGVDSALVVTYSKQLKNIFEGYCLSCHNGGTIANLNIDLSSYAGAKNASGRLLGSLYHSKGFWAMPLNTQIDSCSIREVELWINNGMPQ